MTVNYPTQKKKKKPTSPRKTIRPSDVPNQKIRAKPRPVRFEDGQIDKDLAFLSPDKPPRRNGPIKGSEAAKRCVKGGRPAISDAQKKAERDALYEDWADRVIAGKPIQQTGPLENRSLRQRVRQFRRRFGRATTIR